MQSFPIDLIKLITEFVPTPVEIVEHELETTGLPFIAENKQCNTLYLCRIPACKMQDLVVAADTNLPAHIARMRVLVRATKLRHVKMRSDLMAFHLSKV
jgi:hypothetical protein